MQIMSAPDNLVFHEILSHKYRPKFSESSHQVSSVVSAQ
jgi:hypothetical protein